MRVQSLWLLEVRQYTQVLPLGAEQDGGASWEQTDSKTFLVFSSLVRNEFMPCPLAAVSGRKAQISRPEEALGTFRFCARYWHP